MIRVVFLLQLEPQIPCYERHQKLPSHLYQSDSGISKMFVHNILKNCPSYLTMTSKLSFFDSITLHVTCSTFWEVSNMFLKNCYKGLQNANKFCKIFLLCFRFVCTLVFIVILLSKIVVRKLKK